MLPLILEATVRWSILALVVWLGLRALRVKNPHVLMAVWQLVLIASLLMPFLVHTTVLRATLPVPTATVQIPQMLVADTRVFLSAPPVPAIAVVKSAPLDWRLFTSIAYVAIAALLLLRLVVGSVLTLRLCRSASPLREDWTIGHDVRVSPLVNVPVTFATTILLPENCTAWDAIKRRAVMAHEYAHISQGDFYVLLLAAINRAIFWFNPAAWWLNSRIAYLAEARSDAAALRNIEDRARYAEILLGFGAKANRVTMALAMAGTKTVSYRIERILAETILPEKMNWKAWSIVLGGVVPIAAIAVVAVAQIQTTPSATPPAQPQSAQTRPSQTQPLKFVAPDQATLRQRRDEQAKPRKEAEIDPSILDNYIGYYQLGPAPYHIFTITRQGDRLFAHLTEPLPVQVYPESPQKFFYKDVVVPQQISFVTDDTGLATALIYHVNGLERPAPRTDQAQAEVIEQQLAQRIKADAPMPGTEAALRHQIEAFRQGNPDFDVMTEGLAALSRAQVPKIQRQFELLGDLQSLSFRGVGFSGWDVYEARFEHGIVICRILLTPDNKITGLLFQWGP